MYENQSKLRKIDSRNLILDQLTNYKIYNISNSQEIKYHGVNQSNSQGIKYQASNNQPQVPVGNYFYYYCNKY